LAKFTALFVKSAPPSKHEDGNGLRLIKRKDGGGQWVFRFTIHGRRREMGLGGISAVSLKDAREIAAGLRAAVARDIDPIKKRAQEQRDAERSMHLDLSRFRAAPSARLSHPSFKSDRAFPAQC
jgi:hypothetical protein